MNTPLTLPVSQCVLRNRVAKAALSEGIADHASNAPNDRHVRLYRRWGATGAGLILTGNFMVDGRYCESPGNVVVEDRTHMSVLKEIARQAQQDGSLLVAQLSHPGRQMPMAVSRAPPVAPSAVPLKAPIPVFNRPRALTNEEVKDTITRFARTASILKEAGFAGVQIHAAHGYLGSQFLSCQSNLRADEYGGTPTNRMRFLLDVIQAVRAAVGTKDFIVGVKLNSADFQHGGFTMDESMAVVEALQQQPLDFLEISGGTYENSVMLQDPSKFDENRATLDPPVGPKRPEKRRSTQAREAFFLSYAETISKVIKLKMPLMVTGGFRSAAAMHRALAGSVDIIGLGRPFCLEPHLIPKLIKSRADSTLTFSDPRIGLNVKALDPGLNNLWHQEQIHRISDGLEPLPTLGRLNALTRLTFISYIYSPRRSGWRNLILFLIALIFLLFCFVSIVVRFAF